MKRMKQPLLFLSAPLLLAGLLACSGTGPGSEGGGTSQGTLTLDLGADSTTDWANVVMGIKEVDLSSDGTHWSVFSQPAVTFDLLQLQNGAEIGLGSNNQLPAGNYQVKIIWATTNYSNAINLPAYAYPVGGPSGVPLVMPVSTILPGPITVVADQVNPALVMLDTASAVQSFTSASGTQVLFQPSAQVFDASSCSITGTVVNGSSAGIAGAEVFAEVVDGTGTPSILRRALTNASGAYRLDGLPSSLGGTTPGYFIVAMPAVSASSSYLANGVGPVTAQASHTISAPALAFTGPVATGQIAATLTPPTPSGHGTFVDLRQTINLGTSSQFLIVRANAAATGTASDTRAFAALPSSSYGVNATRFVPGGQVTGSGTSGSLVTVSSGVTTPVSITVN